MTTTIVTLTLTMFQNAIKIFFYATVRPSVLPPGKLVFRCSTRLADVGPGNVGGAVTTKAERRDDPGVGVGGGTPPGAT